MDTLRLVSSAQNPGRQDDPVIRRAADLLRQGGVVALPTETVYGLAAAGTAAGTADKLRSVKGREADKPFAQAFASAAEAFAHVPEAPLPARRLAERFWPGPLTLVLQRVRSPGERGESIGLRIPGHPVTLAILRALGGPVTLTSANPAGQPPALDVAGVLAYFDGHIDAVLDGGPSALGQASTVARIGPRGLSVLRSGILTVDDLRRAAMVRILFVCTGNTCRSPMAAALLAQAVSARSGIDPEQLEAAGYVIRSAGLAAAAGAPGSRGAAVALAARGLELGDHRSQPVTRELLDQQDMVFALTSGHMADLKSVAAHPERVRHIDIDGNEIVDPFGGTDHDYGVCAEQIARCVTRIAEEL